MNRDQFVKFELEQFVRSHDPAASVSCIDEIVLSYMVSILEELGNQQACDDAFDVEDFAQMMEAYIPAFASIDSIAVSEWMFDLAHKLSSRNKTEHTDADRAQQQHHPFDLPIQPEGQLKSQISSNNIPCRQRTISNNSSTSAESQGQNRSRTSSMLSEEQAQSTRSRKGSSRHSSISENEPQEQGELGARASECSLEDDEEIKMLLEMFPAACKLEASHCMGMCNGDLEHAAQLMLHRQEAGDTITQTAARLKKTHSKRGRAETIGDTDLKKHIVQKYSYVDVDDDNKQHNPVVKPQGSKKLLRYLDGRVVSTRGEKFTEIKKSEDEEKMKKTFVNLKPARQYRFH